MSDLSSIISLSSAKWQKNFWVSTGFHRFPGFPKPRNSRNPETNYFIDYLFNHRWIHEIGHGLPSFLVSWFLLVSKGCPGGETRGNWNAKVLIGSVPGSVPTFDPIGLIVDTIPSFLLLYNLIDMGNESHADVDFIALFASITRFT